MKENILLFVTSNLAVRRLVPDDAELLYKYSQEASNKELPNDIFDSLEDARRRLDLVIANYRIEHLPVYFGVVLKSENKLIGVLSYKRMPDYNIMINFSIAEEYQHHGYATELIRAAGDNVKEHLSVDKAFVCIRSSNEYARRALEAAGFSLIEEGEHEWYGTMQPICKYRI